MSVVGFDFGNQTCYIAVARQGGIETIANEYSDRVTPSCVSFGDSRRFMGASAKQQQIANFKNTVSGWKPFVGRKYNDPLVKKEKDTLSYELVEDANGHAAIKVRYLNEDQEFSPEQITAMMLTKLKQTAFLALNVKIVDCVISVPCFATDVERRSMLSAANIAGLNCLKLMNDTTATALTYGIYKQDWPAIDAKSKYVVFVDMGYTGFQVSACGYNKGKLEVLATSFDSQLGGRDFDMIIANHFAEEFKVKYGPKVNAHNNPRAMTRLINECEKLKKRMSSYAGEMPLSIECFMNDTDVSGKLGRDDLIKQATSLLERSEKTMRDILKFSKLSIDDIDAVEIVGGSTRIPAIKELVEKIFKKEPSTTLNADESVVRGCALQCAILSPTFRVRDFIITDCQPYSISLHWEDPLQNNSSSEVFERFHTIPFAKLLTFYRNEPFSMEAKYSDQSTVPHTDDSLGTFRVDNIKPKPSGESSKIKIKLRVNGNGLFSVSSASLVEKVIPVEETKPEGEKVDDKEVEKSGSNGMDWESSKTEGTGDSNEKVPEDTDKASQAKKEKKDEKSSKSPSKEKTNEKKKSTVKQIVLPVSINQSSLSVVGLDILFEKECQMVSQDKLEFERLNAKNTVEEYVYDIRDKISTIYSKFVTEKDTEVFQAKLNETENWLYEEGEDEKKQVYIDRYNELKKMGNPISERYNEFEIRPTVLEEMGKQLQLIRKSVEKYDSKDEELSHLEPDDVKKVRECIEQKNNFYETALSLFASLPAYETASVKVSQMKSEIQSLVSVCTPIMMKPKPKPKETTPPPPEPTASESKDDEKKGEKEDDKEDKKPEEEKPVEAGADMDLD